MALLEERRRKLTAEGLFETARKRPLPYLPKVIGVVTSPTGSVIRDILHRLEDRFPRHVLVWPVRVQGETSAAEVAAAIRGFNAMSTGGAIPRPDVLIVARGGGSIEDLWGFNEEIVVRAAVESEIPLVAAVGHETDWTLIDHAADVRAPTPTGAAEMVVPVRVELAGRAQRSGAPPRGIAPADARQAQGRSSIRRTRASQCRCALRRRSARSSTSRRRSLGRPCRAMRATMKTASGKPAATLARFSPASRLAAMRARLDALGPRPRDAVERVIAARTDKLRELGNRLSAARALLLRAEVIRITQRRDTVLRVAERLRPAFDGQVARKQARYVAAAQLFDSLNYKSVLARGFALVRDGDGVVLRSAAAIAEGQKLVLEFVDGTADAIGGRSARPKTGGKTKPGSTEQGALF